MQYEKGTMRSFLLLNVLSYRRFSKGCSCAQVLRVSLGITVSLRNWLSSVHICVRWIRGGGGENEGLL